MKPRLSPLTADLLFHVLLLAVQLLALLPGGFLQNGTTPPLVYPCWLILSTVTVFRQSERLEEYQTRLILIPSILSCILFGICLVNEFTRDLWAFAIPRFFPVYVRILWYQSGLLLLHPDVFERVSSWMGIIEETLRKRGYFHRKVGFIAVCAIMLMWLLRSQNISPDGYDWLYHSTYTKHWVRYLREPFGTFLFFLFVQFGMIVFHWTAYVSITVLNIFCGILTTLFLRRVFRYAIPQPFAGVALLLLIGSYGYTQIFVGNIEIYALLHLGLSIFLYSVVRYIQNEWSIWTPGFIFGALFCLHLSAGWWIPAFLLVPLLKNSISQEKKSSLPEIVRLLLGFACFAIPFGLFVLIYGYEGDFMALWHHFWGDQVMNVGADGSMFRKPEAYITFNVYLAMFNEYCCMMAGGILLFIVLLASRPTVKNWTPFCRWTALLTGMYMIYSIVWNPDRHFPADWDLFSGLTIPAILLISQIVSRFEQRRETILYLFYQATVFSGLYLFLQLLYNHNKITGWPDL